MHFLRRIMASVSNGPRSRQERRSTISRHQSPIELERLETRDLLTSGGIAITLSYGNLAITAPTNSGGNVVTVSNVSNEVAVSVSGTIVKEFAPSQVSNITYEGGYLGRDVFTNDTSIVLLAYGYGDGNDFIGGSGYNYIFFENAPGQTNDNNDNTFNGSAGIYSDVFEYAGTGDTIIANKQDNNVYIDL
jgi:hypothetical protein